MEPGLTNLMAKSRDYDTLVAAWKGWRDATGKKMKDLYAEFVELRNEGARMSGRKYFCCIHIIIFSLPGINCLLSSVNCLFTIYSRWKIKAHVSLLVIFINDLQIIYEIAVHTCNKKTYDIKKKRFKCLICHATLTLIWYTLI